MNATDAQRARWREYTNRYRKRHPKRVLASAKRSNARHFDKVQATRKADRDGNYAKHRDWKLKGKFGITFAEYHALLVAQDYRCAICRRFETRKLRGKVVMLAVDHCHKTNKIRGLLCSKCNAGLGLFNDDAALFRAAIQYVEKNK